MNGIIMGARLGVRFVMISNNLQRLTDPTGTISDRFIFLKTTQSFYGREDLELEGRLTREMPGILNWSLEGLRRLKKRGFITEPAESVEMRTQSKEIGSNIIAFVNNGCRIGDGLYTEPDTMYDAFKRWCEEDGSKPMKKRAFRQEFSEAFPAHACSKHRLSGSSNPVWVYWDIEPCVAYAL
jgi:putative DNA primase/helicase